MKLSIVDFSEGQEIIQSIRHRVFTIEQGVDPELDLDGHDPAAIQVLAYINNEAVGTGRIREDGHIGRIAVLKEHRRKGVGKAIMAALIEQATQKEMQHVYLGAQINAVPFYGKLGFKPAGNNYMEANILHTPMSLTL